MHLGFIDDQDCFGSNMSLLNQTIEVSKGLQARGRIFNGNIDFLVGRHVTQFRHHSIFFLPDTAAHDRSHFIEKCRFFYSIGIIKYQFLEMRPKKMGVSTINE